MANRRSKRERRTNGQAWAKLQLADPKQSFTGVAMIHVQGRACAKERAANLDGPGEGLTVDWVLRAPGLAQLGNISGSAQSRLPIWMVLFDAETGLVYIN
ncbi:hypothetical protein CIHG_05462 [Coccidioides immitis H538.4]|uniref:Uncharacterized protein n=1 Tax=Coccidioides immitis H538.4 TaxID=396776 RepID=A0A0J8RR95_COCIT|nr:hypothetical protein CIHG_05462 [Coccidioides immitis H538.4]